MTDIITQREQGHIVHKRKGWIGVDLDGTLAHYDGWKGELHIGEPILPMVDRIQQWIMKGFEVRIFTARVAEELSNKDGSLRDAVAIATAIEEWCEKHIGHKLRITNKKDFDMIELWDDRCIQVIPNTGMSVMDFYGSMQSFEFGSEE